jgi:hypothetical protein
MKRTRLCLAIVAITFIGLGSVDATAQEQQAEKGTFGIGLIIGEPTGISAKLYLSDDTAVAGAVGSAVVGGGLHAHADFLWHPWILTGTEAESKFIMPAYIGVGGRVLSHDRGRDGDDDFHFGGRGVIGIAFDFKTIPLDVFVELAGIAEWKLGGGDSDHKGFGLTLNAGAGARYYF